MDLASFGITGVAAITVLCYIAGEVVKLSKLDNKWIPVVCGLVGLALGIVAMFIMPDFPGVDYITSAAIGVMSGLAATGVNQIFKQLKN